MTEVLLTAPEGETLPVLLVADGDLGGLSPFEQGLAAVAEFKGKAGQLLVVPGADGRTARVLFGLGDPAKTEAMLFRGLAPRLAAGDYRLDGLPERLDPTQVATAFALGQGTGGRPGGPGLAPAGSFLQAPHEGHTQGGT